MQIRVGVAGCHPIRGIHFSGRHPCDNDNVSRSGHACVAVGYALKDSKTIAWAIR